MVAGNSVSASAIFRQFFPPGSPSAHKYWYKIVVQNSGKLVVQNSGTK
jgi:hypothetical protein